MLTKHDSSGAVIGIEEGDAYAVARLQFDLGRCLEGKGFLNGMSAGRVTARASGSRTSLLFWCL